MTVENEPEIEKDELEALDALEKEASEFNKVKLLSIEVIFFVIFPQFY